MLCDEPTGALDVRTGVRVLDALVKVNQRFGSTMLLVTHNADVARLGDRVVRFLDGGIRTIEETAAGRRLPSWNGDVMRVLDRKVLRDLWRMKINVFAIMLVLGCGVAILVTAVGMRGSLERTRLAYYASHKMADLAVSLVRAPRSVAEDLARISGVSAAEARVMGLAMLDFPDVTEPASAQLVSLPVVGRPKVNDLSLSKGAGPTPAARMRYLSTRHWPQQTTLRLGKRSRQPCMAGGTR